MAAAALPAGRYHRPMDGPAPASPSFLARIPANPHGRDFAVGDIHGCFTALWQALEHIGFDPARDRLFSVGDLVNRGPESAQVLHWLAQPWFHAISGNHDLMAWRHALGRPHPQVDVLAHGGGWLASTAPQLLARIARQLQALPLAMEVATPGGPVGLVHADCPSDDWQDLREHTLSPSDQDCCLWSRQRYQRRYAAPVRNVRAVVHGHTTVPTMQTLGNVFFIDTGGWRGGQGHFTLLDLHTLAPLRGPGPAAVESVRRRYL